MNWKNYTLAKYYWNYFQIRWNFTT